MYDSASTAYVALTPPLPCTLQVGAGHRGGGPSRGFVVALASDRLRLVSSEVLPAAAAPPLGGAFDVELATAEGRLFSLAVELIAVEPQNAGPDHAATSSFVLRARDLETQERLTDLLNLIRKDQHIRICAESDVEARDRYTGLSDVILRPRAVPELNWQSVDTRSCVWGRSFSHPFLITGMTGGIERGAEINRRLALAAAHFGIPMGVGSQRLALDNAAHAPIFQVKRYAPDLFLIGNLGLAQLVGASPDAVYDACARSVAMIEADALAIHLNVLQELVQPEGDRQFVGVLAALEKLIPRLSVPIVVKEVGCGLDVASARALWNVGVRSFDVGGKGGTSWAYIEGLRSAAAPTRAMAEAFRDFGMPTGVAVTLLREALPEAHIFATGGVRDGLAAAKAVGLGADLVGVGLPLLRAALTGEKAPFDVLEGLTRGFRAALLACGVENGRALRRRLAFLPAFAAQVDAYRDEALDDGIDLASRPARADAEAAAAANPSTHIPHEKAHAVRLGI